MRILIVMPLARQLGGGELMLRQLLRQPRPTDVTFIVAFLRDGPMVEEARALGHDVHVVPAGRFRDVVARGRAVRALAALARTTRADVMLGWMVASQIMVGPAARLAGIPSVWFQVGIPDGGWLDRIATLLPTNGVIVLSKAGEAAQGALTPKWPMRLVYPGVSLNAYDPSALPDRATARAALGLPSDGPLIGIVGRLQRWKGMHLVIEAMPEVLARHADARLVIVGGPHETEPAYPDVLARRVSELGLQARVHLVGFQQEIPLWMQAMDVVVHASDREPFGIVVIEAMALGKPVVAGAAGGPAEVVTDAEDGLLVPYGDVDGLAAAIVRFLDDPALAARCGERARLRAAAFEERRYADAVIRAVRDLTGR